MQWLNILEMDMFKEKIVLYYKNDHKSSFYAVPRYRKAIITALSDTSMQMLTHFLCRSFLHVVTYSNYTLGAQIII